MKKILALSLFVVGALMTYATQSYADVNVLNCGGPNPEDFFIIELHGSQALGTNCTDSASHKFQLSLSGIDVGLAMSNLHQFHLMYLGFAESPAGIYVGTEVEASFLLGLDAMVAVGDSGTLMLLGWETGLAANVGAVELSIK